MYMIWFVSGTVSKLNARIRLEWFCSGTVKGWTILKKKDVLCFAWLETGNLSHMKCLRNISLATSSTRSCLFFNIFAEGTMIWKCKGPWVAWLMETRRYPLSTLLFFFGTEEGVMEAVRPDSFCYAWGLIPQMRAQVPSSRTLVVDFKKKSSVSSIYQTIVRITLSCAKHPQEKVCIDKMDRFGVFVDSEKRNV